VPSGYKQLTAQDIAQISSDPVSNTFMAGQEKGVRPSCALPYELMADGNWNADKQRFEIMMSAGKQRFGVKSAGAPFSVYAPVNFKDETGKTEHSRNWSFAVIAGDKLSYDWPADGFENGQYHLRLHAPNGFYREFKGNGNDPAVLITCEYEQGTKTPSNVLILTIQNQASTPVAFTIKDHAYQQKAITRTVAKGSQEKIKLALTKSHGWYDFSVLAAGFNGFEKRYAGHVETGVNSVSDPFMGRV
jgi:phospholipase C